MDDETTKTCLAGKTKAPFKQEAVKCDFCCDHTKSAKSGEKSLLYDFETNGYAALKMLLNATGLGYRSEKNIQLLLLLID